MFMKKDLLFIFTFQTISWVSKLDSQLYPIITTNSTRPSEIIELLENKLVTVLPEIKKAQHELEEKIHKTEELITKAQASDDQTVAVKSKLNEVQQRLIETNSEYQILLQVLIGYFKNLAEIDKKAENLNSQFDKNLRSAGDVENILREHELSKETITELFRFAQSECQQISERISKQVIGIIVNYFNVNNKISLIQIVVYT